MIAMPPIPFLSQDQDIAFTFWCEGVEKADLLVTAFTVEEAIFGLTRIEISLASRSPGIDLQAMMDTKATLSIHHKYLPDIRYFSGIVVEAERGDEGHHHTGYRVVLLPALARLNHGSDCRIFQQKSAADIIEETLKHYGITDISWQIISEAGSEGTTGNAADPVRPTHPVREYCVQYKETHLAFIERLMSEEGCWYFFEHGDRGRHTLVIANVPEVVPPCPGGESLTYNAMASGVSREVYCSSLRFREKLRSNSYTQRDHTFLNPRYTQEHTASVSETNGLKGDYRLYDYPGRYKRDAAGKPFTKAKLEATRTDASLALGVANAPYLSAGFGIKLTDHPKEALNIKWRLLAVRHEGTQPQAMMEDAQGESGDGEAFEAASLAGEVLAGGAFGLAGSKARGRQAERGGKAVPASEDGAALYKCAFTAQPWTLAYRPPQINKPIADGPEVATVVGPPGEEIFPDKYGRVKVQFPWDRYGENDEHSSCWIKVATLWAGPLYGSVFIPRIGMRVIVAYLNGDIDQPQIIGCDDNAVNMPPYELPKHKTRSTFKTKTHKGNGFNELRFEDENGREEVFIHAERDRNEKTKNNHTERIDNNWVQSIGHNKNIEVDNNHNEVIGGNMTLNVGPSGIGSLVNSSLQKLAEGVSAAARTLGFPGLFNVGQGNMSVFVEKNKTETVGIISSDQAGVGRYFTVGQAFEVFSGSSIAFTASEKMTENVGETKLVEVGEELILTCGQSRLSMKANGEIELEGTNIRIDATELAVVTAKKIKLN